MIPVHNGKDSIARAIASLLAQTVGDWEAVVVDDGSTDGTGHAVQAFGDSRIRLFSLGRNRGRGAARQFALERCAGEFLAMVDADDWWYPWKLERQLAFLEQHPDIGAVSAAMASVGENGEFRGVRGPTGITDGVKEFSPLRSLSGFDVPHAPSLVKMELARSVGYHVDLRRSEDLVFLARVLRCAPYAILPEVLYAYTDAGSFRREGAPARYLSASRACFRLVGDYGSAAILRSVRTAVQFLLAMLFSRSEPISQLPVRRPSAEEVGEFERARREVDAVMRRTGL